ncbi:MAG: Uncharacterized protein FD141_1363 [Fusobacteria bacterium]|nr:MAG: Uncharacterized protein FD141_1363 [Fusobacteriota bacterium]KAF0230076.1 MAG: hypothetical protein FD182_466 [Fusobacteriota bacterium]
MNTLIKNTCLVTVNEARDINYEYAIYIENDRIADIGPTKEMEDKYTTNTRVIDGTDKIVFPGLINTHNHLFQVLLKGLGDDMVLKDWLEFMTFPSTPYLTEENCYFAALNGLMEGIHSGVTTTFDYMYPHAKGYDRTDEGIIKAMQKLGVRGFLGRGWMDTGVSAGVYPAMIENLDDIEKAVRDLHSKYHNIENGRIKIALAPAAVWSNSGESLKLLKKLSDELDLIYSLHVSETPFDREAVNNLHGKDEIDLLIELGLLNEKLIMVHCVCLTDYDISKIKEFGATVSHNPVSNMYLSSGVAPIPRLNREGISVGLGLDGAASNNSNDMIELLKMTSLLQKVHHRNPTIMTADKVLEMATIEGAKALMLDKEIGSLEIGKKADLFIFNPKKDLKAIPMHNPVSTLVYSSGNKNIETVMVDGDILMEDGVVTKIDEGFVAVNCQRLADELSAKAGTDKLKKRPWKRL